MKNSDDLNAEDIYKEKPLTAIALQYDGRKAPIISAKGHHELAEKIIEIAKEHGVMIHEDPALTQLLTQLQLGDEIPRALYVTIARIIAFAYLLNDKTKI